MNGMLATSAHGLENKMAFSQHRTHRSPLPTGAVPACRAPRKHKNVPLRSRRCRGIKAGALLGQNQTPCCSDGGGGLELRGTKAHAGEILHSYPGWTLTADGSLVMATVNEDAEGTYSCTPYNSYGTMGPSGPTRVVLQDPPSFSITPAEEYRRDAGRTLLIPCQGNAAAAAAAAAWRKAPEEKATRERREERQQRLSQRNREIRQTQFVLLCKMVLKSDLNLQSHLDGYKKPQMADGKQKGPDYLIRLNPSTFVSRCAGAEAHLNHAGQQALRTSTENNWLGNSLTGKRVMREGEDMREMSPGPESNLRPPPSGLRPQYTPAVSAVLTFNPGLSKLRLLLVIYPSHHNSGLHRRLTLCCRSCLMWRRLLSFQQQAGKLTSIQLMESMEIF
ncbi:hypothetical protein CCH79_00000692 [Gambusia affinis]|uniref:Ig-like domain-containing protein n=1 Tax=Gambusia affinis TaxID=33528 RepID=A0A315VSU9_GAMAF|nr:hypothetical protein CCH79_00000692 [Gambusia affinis]